MVTINKISLTDIILDTVNNNKSIYLSTGLFTGGILLEQIVFPRMYSNFIANFPDKIEHIDLNLVAIMLSPYIISEVLFYLSDSISSHTFPKIESNVVKKMFDSIIESSKTTKKELNANELILNLKKIFDVRDIYHLVTSYIFPSVAVSIGLIFYFMIADIKFGFVAGIILLIAFLALIKMGNKCFERVQINEKKNQCIL